MRNKPAYITQIWRDMRRFVA